MDQEVELKNTEINPFLKILAVGETKVIDF